MIPGPGASVDARAAIMCTSAQGLTGAAVGIAPTREAARTKAESVLVNIEGLSYLVNPSMFNFYMFCPPNPHK